LDDRPIRVDFDWGFQEGRQWGRGRSGGQVAAFSPLSLSLKYEAGKHIVLLFGAMLEAFRTGC